MKKNFNVISILTLIVLAKISADPQTPKILTASHREFEDMLPELEPFKVAATLFGLQ